MPHARGRDLKRGSGYITPRPQDDGTIRYQARWLENGKWPAKTFDSEDAASDFLRARARKGGTPATMTVNGLVEEMLTRSADRLSARTILTYRTRAAKMIAPFLGSTRLLDLTTLDIQRWIDKLGRDGYKPATIHAAVAVLHSCLRDAAVLGIIDRNIAQGIRRPGIQHIRRAEWSQNEVRRFLSVVKGDEIYGALYHVALATGMRPGELRALPWRDVHLETMTIVVNRTMTKDAGGQEVIGNRTKTRRGRAVAITSPLVTLLTWHRTMQGYRRLAFPEWHDHDLVFDRGDGHWIGQSSWRRAQEQFCTQAGVPFIRAHDLRHTAGALLMELNIHPKVAAEILGHHDVSMTLDRYSQVSPALQRSSAGALSAILFEDPEIDTA